MEQQPEQKEGGVMPEMTERERQLRERVENFERTRDTSRMDLQKDYEEIKRLHQERCAHTNAYLIDASTMHCPECIKYWNDPSKGVSIPM